MSMMDVSSILQGGYHHPTPRKWQAKRELTKSMFMYPIFVTDDPQASVEIPSLPGQRRWGVDRLEGFLRPLVEKGLESVILFGVPLQSEKVSFHFILFFFENKIDSTNRMNGATPQTSLTALSSLPFVNCVNAFLLSSSPPMSVSVNTLPMVIADFSTPMVP